MKNAKIKQMVGIALMSAIVVILQLLGQFFPIGPVSISLVLIPIVVGAAVYGPTAGAILGGVSGIVILLQPDTVWFHNISVIGTIVTVMAKGILSGWISGLAYRILAKRNEWVAVIVAAILCPIVNTGIFAIGCRLFFWSGLTETAEASMMDTVTFLFTGMIGFNFIAEFVANVICAPVISRILHAAKKH